MTGYHQAHLRSYENYPIFAPLARFASVAGADGSEYGADTTYSIAFTKDR